MCPGKAIQLSHAVDRKAQVLPDTKLDDVKAQNFLCWMGIELGRQPPKHSQCKLNLLIPSPESYTCADKARCDLKAPTIPAQPS